MHPNWRDVSPLLRGNTRQQQAYHTLQALAVFSVLRDFDLVLTTTLSLGIDVPSSDLDIICEVHDFDRFQTTVEAALGQFELFKIRHTTAGDMPGIVASFRFQDFSIELFGEPQPVEQQNAYRHLCVAARLLEIGGEPARRAIQQLKAVGLKTEPAFADYFGLSGDPYQAMLELESLTDDELRNALHRRT